MRPLLHPRLINGRFGDPALYVETLFDKHAILLDLGDISSLAPRHIHRIDQVLVSHAHIDHFFGFDYLLRVLVGRSKQMSLYGPPGFIANVSHKLQAYRWNLAARYADDLVFTVTEIDSAGPARAARARLKTAFALEELDCPRLPDGHIQTEAGWRVSFALLDHRTPCLGFAVEETVHVNVWKTKLDERGLPVGPWLRELKQAVLSQSGDDHPVAVGSDVQPLGALRDLITITPGQKIGYVTDVADTPANRAAIVALVGGADLLFIEAPFAAADAALAADRAHLTTTAAGEIARAAGVRRVEPFHFSPRYEGEEARMLAEVAAAFSGNQQAEG